MAVWRAPFLSVLEVFCEPAEVELVGLGYRGPVKTQGLSSGSNVSY